MKLIMTEIKENVEWNEIEDYLAKWTWIKGKTATAQDGQWMQWKWIEIQDKLKVTHQTCKHV